MSEAIVRELTAPAPGAVRVLEVRGEGAARVVSRIAPSWAPLSEHAGDGALSLARIVSGDEVLDESLVWARRTRPDGELRVELHVHGASPLVARIVAELRSAGARVERAEDARGRTRAIRSIEERTSIEERARARLVDAPCEAAARVLLDQAEGALRCELERLLDALAGGRSALAREIALGLVERGERARILFDPPLVVLAGPVNAGKSTLFNALVGRERVVVDDTEGTTRDAIRERIAIGDHAIDLVDTAGERDLDDEPATEAGVDVEREGQRLGRALRARADLVIWLRPARGARTNPADAPHDPSSARWAVVESRADEADGAPSPGTPRIRASVEPEEARATVTETIRRCLGFDAPGWQPGAAVPFDDEVRDALADLVARTEGVADRAEAAEAESAVRELLAR